MKKCESEVCSASKPVGTAEYPEYETITEALEAIGEAEVLSRLNAQIRTDAMNQIRGQFNKTPSKATLQRLAMARITEAEFKEVVGDMVRFNALVDAKIKLIEAERKASDEAETSETPEPSNA